ncbi:ABC transporter permease [Peptostreptococcus anaerobius]|uniref:ABC transporter permease n=1 Tax=Peptostreptococcus anaerobius TaxID=1261 RepID=UPI003219B826
MTSILSKFALKNMKTNRVMLVPFILSSSIMLSLFYIMRSLVSNDYVIHRHKDLPMVINFGTLIVAIFTFMFIIYANRYLIKRRSKEFALYSILGLETRHIRKSIFIEEFITFLVIGILSLLEGHVFGKLSFLGLNKIMKDVNVKLMNYTFSYKSALYLFIFTAIIFIAVYIISCWNIRAVSPIQLLAQQKAGQKEPKSKFIISLLGVLLLAGGYYLALASDGTLNSLKNFFVAVVMVIGATYFLFVSFSIWILKLLKKRESYYKTKNFLSISGMLYRMKANGMGLASIAVMSTSVIVTIGSTMSIYSGIEGVVNSKLARDYSISYEDSIPASMSNDEILKIEKSMTDLVKSTVTDKSDIKGLYTKRSSLVPMLKSGSKLDILQKTKSGKKPSGLPVYGLIETLDSYNRSKGKNISLEDNQVLMTSNNKRIMDYDHFKIADKNYRVIRGESDSGSEYAIDAYHIVVKDYKTMVDINKYYSVNNYKIDTNIEALWNLDKNSSEARNESAYTKTLKSVASRNNMDVLTKVDVREIGYNFNGGFLFIGILIGIMFLVGTVLVTYYKQLTEGYEDRANYQIMKKVGLPDDMIKKTASSQIIWMLFIPLFVAVVHTAVASKVLSGLLGLFGVWSYGILVKNLLIVTLVFLVFYLVVFKITSNIYYKIVN